MTPFEFFDNRGASQSYAVPDPAGVGNRTNTSLQKAFATPAGSTNVAGGSGAPNSGPGWGRQVASIGVGFIPFVGSGQSLVELISGKDYITGESANRWLAAGGLVAGLVPGGKAFLKGGAKMFGRIRRVEEAIEMSVKVAKKGDGVVYLRNNPFTNGDYVGQAKSWSRYVTRQAEHNRKLSTGHMFDDLLRGKAGIDLDVLEEATIRAFGGTAREGSILQNLNHVKGLGTDPQFIKAVDGLLFKYQTDLMRQNAFWNGIFGAIDPDIEE